MAISALAILQDLIRRPSVTPHDGGALPYIEALLQAAGFSVELVTFSEPGHADVLNLYARLGTERPHLLFAGHTDVVPVGDPTQWTRDPFGGEVSDGRIYGRGACDMKGGVAASLAAALSYAERFGPPPGSLGFLLTGDEEGPAVNGTVKLLEWARARGERFDHCLLGEPTNPEALGDMMKIGRRGSLSGSLRARGRQGHVAYPHLADNPVATLASVMVTLKAEPLDRGTRHFDPSNLEFTSLAAGAGATNVIPGEAQALFNVRFNDVWSVEALERELTRRVAAAAPGKTVEIAFQPTNATAFRAEAGPFSDLVARAILAETGREPKRSTTGGTSDARFLKNYCETIEFGLVGQTMHMVDENVAIADVEALARIYERVLVDYFGRSSA